MCCNLFSNDACVPPACLSCGIAAAANVSTAAACRTLKGLRGQVVVLTRAQLRGRDCTLSDLHDCSVYLLGPLAALFVHGLERCRVCTGPITSAAFLEGEELTQNNPNCQC